MAGLSRHRCLFQDAPRELSQTRSITCLLLFGHIDRLRRYGMALEVVALVVTPSKSVFADKKASEYWWRKHDQAARCLDVEVSLRRHATVHISLAGRVITRGSGPAADGVEAALAAPGQRRWEGGRGAHRSGAPGEGDCWRPCCSGTHQTTVTNMLARRSMRTVVDLSGGGMAAADGGGETERCADVAWTATAGQ